MSTTQIFVYTAENVCETVQKKIWLCGNQKKNQKLFK